MKNSISKLMAILITLSVSLSVAFVMPITTTATVVAWDGGKADTFADGTGAENDPFLISNGEQLYKMVSEYTYNGSTVASADTLYFELTNDIYLNDTTNSDWTNNSPTPWFSGTIANNKFKHKFNGAGYTVYGLYTDTTSENNETGLFCAVTGGAEISNLIISDAYIHSGWRAAAFAGAYSATINTAAKFINCGLENSNIGSYRFNESTAVASGFISYVFAGGSVEFENCYAANNTISDNFDSATANYPGPAFVAGTANIDTKAKLTNCYSVGSYPIGSQYLSPNPYATLSFECTNVYTDIDHLGDRYNLRSLVTVLELAKMQGFEAKNNMTGLDFISVWNTAYKATPVLRATQSAATVPAVGAPFISGNSAIYDVEGTNYTAFRVFGEYVAPVVEGEVDATKIVVDGKTYEIDSRRLDLWNGDKQLTTNGVDKASGKLASYWEVAAQNEDYAVVRYSVLIKKVPESAITAGIDVKAVISYNDGTVEESAKIGASNGGPTFSAETLYNAYCATLPAGTDAPAWFNN